MNVFKDETRDPKPSNVATTALQYEISPEYFRAAGTALLSGRALTAEDDKNVPRVAVINQEFALRIFGSEANALGRYFKTEDGSRHKVVGIAENGKYFFFNESQQPAMFLRISQTGPVPSVWLVVRSARNPQQLAATAQSSRKEAIHSSARWLRNRAG